MGGPRWVRSFCSTAVFSKLMMCAVSYEVCPLSEKTLPQELGIRVLSGESLGLYGSSQGPPLPTSEPRSSKPGRT